MRKTRSSSFAQGMRVAFAEEDLLQLEHESQDGEIAQRAPGFDGFVVAQARKLLDMTRR